MWDDYFKRDRRIIIFSLFVFILAGTQQIVGWIFIREQYIYKTENCTYYLSGTYICPDVYRYPNYYNHLNNCDSCIKAAKVQALFIVAILYPLLCLIYMGVFLGCLLLFQARKYSAIKCSQMFLIICYFLSMILLFSDANNITNFSNSTPGDINIKIRDACIGLGTLCILQLLSLFGLYYDVHSYIQEKTIIQQPIMQYQQPIIIYNGMHTQRSQVNYNIPQNNIISYETIINQNDHQFYDQATQAQFIRSQQQQNIDGLPILTQPIYGLPINQLQVTGQLEYCNPTLLQPIEGLAIKK